MTHPLLIGSRWIAKPDGFLDREAADIDLIAPFSAIEAIVKELTYPPPSARNDRTLRKALVLPLSPNKTKIIVTGSRSEGFPHVEIEIAWPGSTGEELIALVEGAEGRWSNYEKEIGQAVATARIQVGTVTVAPLNVLYTLKMSHRYLRNSPHFQKTMRDIHAMRRQGAQIFDQAWLRRREAETYNYGHPKLNTSKEGFFTGDGVRYIFDHDSIHEAVAWPKKPAYLSYRGDGEVMCDRAKFEALPIEERLRGVREEAYVLALERSQIPHGDLPGYMMSHPAFDLLRPSRTTPIESRPSPVWSFEKALEKVCTSITSGWFREFAWENYDAVWGGFDEHYAAKFWQKAIERKIVLMHKDAV